MDPDRRFERRLAEAIAWCESRARLESLGTSLRSRELAPDLDEMPPLDRWPGLVEQLCRDRSASLGTDPQTARPPGPGRLLVFDPGHTLSDGAARVESEGYFDDDNVPPWDTWVAFVVERPRRPGSWTAFDAYLISYVPAALITTVDRAIAVNPERCIEWAEELARPVPGVLGAP